MNIAVFHPQPEGALGGGEYVASELVDFLSGKHDVKFFVAPEVDVDEFRETFNADIDCGVEKVEPGVLCDSVNSLPVFSMVGSILRNRVFLKTAKSVENDFDLIIFSCQLWEDSIELDTPSIQYVHSGPSSVGFDSKIYRMFIHRLSSLELFQSDYVVFNSKFMETEWRKPEDSEARVVYPPVQSEIEWRPNKGDKAVILGRLSRGKMIEDAIEICASCDLNLTILGLKNDEKYFHELKAIVAERDNITLIPDASRNEIKSALESASLGFSCRRGEPFGITTVEYLKAGCIPIVHDSGGPKEIVKYEEFTYESLEEAEKNIENNLDRFEEVKEKVKERSEKFSLTKFTEEMNQIIELTRNL